MPNKLNLKTQGGISGGFRGSQIQKSGLSKGWTDWHQMWYTSANSSGNGHRLSTICPSTLGGGVRGSQIQKSGRFKRLVRLAPNVVHMCIFIWEWIYAKQIAPRDTRGHLGVLGGHTFKGQGKLSNGWTDWHQRWFTSADSSGNGHRLYKSPLNTPGGMSGGGGVCQGVTNSKALRSCQKAGPIGTKWVHLCGFIWEWT